MNPFTTHFGRAATSIAWRQLHVMFSKPSLFLPSLIFPLFFFAAFAGGLSAVGNAPNFDYPSYTTFQYVFVLMQSAIFGGVFTGFAIAADFEFGFARRMLLATPQSLGADRRLLADGARPGAPGLGRGHRGRAWPPGRRSAARSATCSRSW